MQNGDCPHGEGWLDMRVSALFPPRFTLSLLRVTYPYCYCLLSRNPGALHNCAQSQNRLLRLDAWIRLSQSLGDYKRNASQKPTTLDNLANKTWLVLRLQGFYPVLCPPASLGQPLRSPCEKICCLIKSEIRVWRSFSYCFWGLLLS